MQQGWNGFRPGLTCVARPKCLRSPYTEITGSGDLAWVKEGNAEVSMHAECARLAVRKGQLYPLAEGEWVPVAWDKKAARVRATGEFREPKDGEWFLSGAIVEGYQAFSDLTEQHHIAVLVRGEYVTGWREVPSSTE